METREGLFYMKPVEGMPLLCTLDVRVRTEEDMQAALRTVPLPKNFIPEKLLEMDCADTIFRNRPRARFVLMSGTYAGAEGRAVVSQYFGENGVYERVVSLLGENARRLGAQGRWTPSNDWQHVSARAAKVDGLKVHGEYARQVTCAGRYLITGATS